MTAPRPSRDGERGAAVILFVALVVAAAIAAAAAMMVGRPQFAVQQNTGTGFDLTALRKAVEAHAMVVNGDIVVCPDTDGDGTANGGCGSPSNGLVPWRDIGVTARQATDAWGQPVRIVRSASQNLRLSSYRGGVNEGPCHFLLVSGGDDGTIDANLTVDPVDVRDVGATRDRDLAVCGKLGGTAGGGGAQFDLDRTNGDGSADIDLVEGTVDNTARKTVAPYVGQVNGENAVIFGERNPDGTFKKVQTNNYTSCYWIDRAFEFKKTLRAYFKFRFYPGQYWDNPDSDKTTGDGFTFTVLPGNQDTTDAATGKVCGKAGNNQGLGYKDGVPLPKMAVEFDIYNNNYGDENALRHNHAAILLTWRTDYIGNGSADNPPCRAQDLSTFGSENACTHRRAVDGFAAPNVIFMEERDSATFDYIEGGQAGKLYPVRIELNRGCNADCSSCGDAAGQKMRTKVWIGCEDEACKDTSKDFTGDWTENSINYCHADPSVEYMTLNPATSPTLLFDTARVGFTMGANGFNTGVMYTNILLSGE